MPDKYIRTILISIITAVILTSGSTQIYLLNRMSVLENKVQTNSQSVSQINSKIDVLIESTNKMTQESIQLQEQLKYLERDKK